MLTGTGAVPPAGRAAVLGSPIAHSLSPVLHRAAYAALGLDGWRYEALEIADAAALQALVRSCAADREWAGLSLTMPLKRVIQPVLHTQSSTALTTGSVNTVLFVRGEDGVRLEGHNTDVTGIVEALRPAGVSAHAGDEGPERTAVVLGGGATAASAVAALISCGIRRPAVMVRSAARATEVVQAAERAGGSVRLLSWTADAPDAVTAPGETRGELLGADVVVSTVPISATEQAVALLGEGEPRGVLLDVVYNPWPTPLAQAWERQGRAAGAVVVGGFEMLLHQAVEQVRLMTGQLPPVQAMRVAGLAELERRAGLAGSR